MNEKSVKLSELMTPKGKRKETKRPMVRDYKEAKAACGRK